jgi:hypothetical protein
MGPSRCESEQENGKATGTVGLGDVIAEQDAASSGAGFVYHTKPILPYRLQRLTACVSIDNDPVRWNVLIEQRQRIPGAQKQTPATERGRWA